jgi:hypothetical protein
MKKLEAEYDAEYKRINKRSDKDIEEVKQHARDIDQNPAIRS